MVGSAASLVSKSGCIGYWRLSLWVVKPDEYAKQDALVQAVGQSIDIYRSLGMKEEDLEKLGSAMQEMMNLIKNYFCRLGFAAAAIVDTYLNFVIAKAVMKKIRS